MAELSSDNFLEVEKNSVMQYRSNDYKRYSIWVYDDSNIIQVFGDEKPNTCELWFEFYEYTHLFWKMMEYECIEQSGFQKDKTYVYSFYKLKRFYLKYLLRSTNYPIALERNESGELTEETYDRLMKIHSRIWRELFDKIEFFVDGANKEEEQRLAKECAILFGKGDSVSNPHKYIVFYCDLMAFWDKFGLNYFDIQRLPQEVFAVLKKMMSLESDFKTKKPIDTNNTPQYHNGRKMPPVGKKTVVNF